MQFFSYKKNILFNIYLMFGMEEESEFVHINHMYPFFYH